MSKPRSWRPSWIMQIENPPQGFLSGNQAKLVLHIHVTAKPLKKYTSHNMVDYITDRDMLYTSALYLTYYVFFF